MTMILTKQHVWRAASVVLLMLLTTASAWAALHDEFTVNHLRYVVISENPNKVSILGYDGDMPANYAMVIPASVTHNTTQYAVTSFQNAIFLNKTNLKSVNIPASVTRIGQQTFDGCTNLTTVSGCEGVTEVFNNAFNGTAWLAAQPDGVIYIGKVAYLGKNVSGDVSIDASTVFISPYAFYGCSGLTSVTLNGAAKIKDNAFPSGVTVIIADGLYLHNGTEVLSGNVTDMSKLNDKNLRVAIPYIADNGNTAYCTDFTVLTSEKKSLASGWYVVNSDITYTGTVAPAEDAEVNIILCDGCTMNIGTYDSPINGGASLVNGTSSLTIYGQSRQTGALRAYSTCNTTGGSGVTLYNYTQNGGNVTIFDNGSGNAAALRINNLLTLNRGTLDVTGRGSSQKAIWSDAAGNDYRVIMNGGKLTAYSYDSHGVDAYVRFSGGNFSTTGYNYGTYKPVTLSWSSPYDSFYSNKFHSLTLLLDNSIHNGNYVIAKSDGNRTWTTEGSELQSKLDNKVLTPAEPIGVTGNSVVDGEYWATFYHPGAGYTADENTTVYKAAVNTLTNKVELTEVTGREIPANKAVVLKSTSSAINISRALPTETLDGNELRGGTAVANGKVAYTLANGSQGVGFYKFVGAALNPNKAHLEIATPAQSAPAFFGFDHLSSSGQTAVAEMRNEALSKIELGMRNDGWHTLDGRKLQGKPTKKGVYINNGRKIIIK